MWERRRLMTSQLERQTLRKISWRIVPFIMLLYFVSFIDRVNIGFASLTMNKDLGFSSAVFGFGAGIFFLGYFLFEVPSNIILDRVGARLWIARVMVTWGLISVAFAFIQGETSFYILRFLLGVAEAGFFPGIILYLSYWFPARRRAQVVSFFMAAAPISTVLGSPLSSALLEMDGIAGLKGWQWMRRLTLGWGLHSVEAPQISSVDEMSAYACEVAIREGFATKGDIIVVATGTPVGMPGTTNTLKILTA